LLEGRKRYVTLPGVEGFVAYECRAGLRVIAGDPVCAAEDMPALLRRARRGAPLRPCFAYAVSPRTLPAFHAAGFAAVGIGAEPVFDPRSFSLAGGARATIRAAVNHARSAGVVVAEHVPAAIRRGYGPPDVQATRQAEADAEVQAVVTDRELADISREWLAGKGGEPLGFLLGDPAARPDSRKRWFVARRDERVEAFVVLEPVLARGGWYLDVTRRRPDAPRGTMELLTTEVLLKLGREGVPYASMGLSPLARLEACDALACDSPRFRHLLGRAFESVTAPYDFRALHRYKLKYHPDAWVPHFLAYTPGAGERLGRLVVNLALARSNPARGSR